MLYQFLPHNKQSESAICIHIFPYPLPLEPPSHLPIPPIQMVTKHRADLPVLCNSFPLAIHFIFGNVYMSVLLSHFIPASPSPLCPQARSLRLRLYSCLATRFISTVFLDSIYVCQHMVFVFLFLTYFSLYDRLQVHLPHYR